MFNPAFFGTKPELVIKSGIIVWGNMGDANASIPTTQPIIARSMFGANAGAASKNSLAFVSKASIERGVITKYGLKKRVEAVSTCRSIGKKDMKLNDALPKVEVDPETYAVSVDGELCDCEPMSKLPLTQSVYLF